MAESAAAARPGDAGIRSEVERLIALGGVGTARTLEVVLGGGPVPNDGLLNMAANTLWIQIERLVADRHDAEARATAETMVALIAGYARASRAADRRGEALFNVMDGMAAHDLQDQTGLSDGDAKATWDVYREVCAERGGTVAEYPSPSPGRR